MSVAGIAADDARLAGSGRPTGVTDDPLAPVDDVMVRQDAAVGVDDEAGAGAAARRIVGIAALGVAPTASQVERRVEVVEIRRLRRAGRASACRPRALLDASMLTTAGLMRSTTSAKSIEAPGREAGAGAPRACAGASGAGTGDSGRPLEPAGEDGADQERDGRGEAQRDDSETPRHLGHASIIRARKAVLIQRFDAELPAPSRACSRRRRRRRRSSSSC